jgi:hypothetical protein
MARRSKEDAQDIAMHHMDKINRKNKNNESKSLSLKDQLARQELSSTEKIKRMSIYDWNKTLEDKIRQSKTVNERLGNYVKSVYKKEFERFRSEGTPFNEVIAFIFSKGEEYFNS